MKFLNSIILMSSIVMNSVHGEVKYFSKCIKDGDFAITFDDGPSLDYTKMVLDTLDEFNVKATFFVNGKNCVDITTNPTAQELIKREYESGHVIGSHTFTHPSGITNLTDEELTYQLEELNKAIYNLVGVKPAFFRPPLGEYSEDNLKIIEKCGIKANILWNLDSEDWDHNYNATQQYIDGLEGKDPKTHSFIALNHDIQKVTAEKNLRIVIPYLRKLGYNFVPMDVCIGLPAYQGQELNTNKKGITKDPNGEIVIENPQNLNANNGNDVANTAETNANTNANADANANADTNTNADANSNTNANATNADANTNTQDINKSNSNNNTTSDATTVKTSIIFSSAFMILVAFLFL